MAIFQMSAQAGLFIAAILIIRAAALNRLPKMTFLVLWGFALLRLLVPLSFSSVFSVYGGIKNTGGGARAEFPSWSGEAIIPAAELATAQTGNAAYALPLPIAIWLFGVLGMSIVFAVLYIRSYRKLRFSPPIRSNAIVDGWTAQNRLRRPLKILESDRITTPVAIGLIRPRIILPKTMDTGDARLMEYVLTHEYFHVRRFDMLWKLLALGAVCIHWFNPLVWVMLIFINRDLEITCDEMVVRRFGAGQRTAYAISLIGMAARRGKISPLYSGFSKNTAEERITAIMKFKKHSILIVLASACLVLLLTAGFTSNPVEKADTGDRGEPDTIDDTAQIGSNDGPIVLATEPIAEFTESAGADITLDDTAEHIDIAQRIHPVTGETFWSKVDLITGEVWVRADEGEPWQPRQDEG